MQFIMSGSILFLPPYTQGEKKHLVWAGIEPDLASQATNLTTRPWLLGLLAALLEVFPVKESSPLNLSL